MENRSIFASIARDFNVLAEGPIRLMGGGEKLRPLSLDEAKTLILSRATSLTLRDQIWSGIVVGSRAEGDAWKTIAVGMALPGLTNLARQMARDYVETNYEDVCGEIIVAFLDALRRVDIDRPAILTRMYWATYRAIRRSAYTEMFAARDAAAMVAEAGAGTVPKDGHPDLVLAQLVAECVITDAEASLISAVRLDRRSLGDVAEVLGISANAVLLRLRKAEMCVAAHLTGTTVGSRRAFKRGRKGEPAGGPDSFGGVDRTSVIEEPPGILAA